jgi:hypothetical protein
MPTEYNWATNEFLDIVLNDEFFNNLFERMTRRDPEWTAARAEQVATSLFEGIDMRNVFHFSSDDWNDIDWDDVAAFWTDDEAVAQLLADEEAEYGA